MARNIDSGRLSVMLWGQEIGQLCWNPAKGNSYFFFSPEYLSSGLDIAPLTASSKSPAARFAIYGNTDSAKYQKHGADRGRKAGLRSYKNLCRGRSESV